MKNKFVFCGVLFLIAAARILSQDAASIVERSRNRIQAETTSSRSQMVITARNGTQTERVIDQYTKDDTSGNRRALIIFQSPASVAGTRFLTMENPGREDDRWIFLPSLGRVRRIAASEGSGSFVGTDFSYDDISSADRNASLDNHRLLREEVYNGVSCYVIESTPKDTSYQYSKMIQFIEKERLLVQKIELFDRRGDQVKLLEILEYREVQGRTSAFVTRITTLAAGTSTTINVSQLKYDDPIPERVFTTAYLETGR